MKQACRRYAHTDCLSPLEMETLRGVLHVLRSQLPLLAAAERVFPAVRDVQEPVLIPVIVVNAGHQRSCSRGEGASKEE